MEWTKSKYRNAFNEERTKWYQWFVSGDTEHLMEIKHYDTNSFEFFLDSQSLCSFPYIENAMAFGFGLTKGFEKQKELIKKDLINYFK